ncbi:MAG TPA: adenylate/guanylate cyclase domain-containing protein, partial [Bacteroidota bacterium]|nr:adenylate/guanylate cyclase domain-containing protein [Bacteroidota bacterium]
VLNGWGYVVEFFLRLKLRVKLSVIVGISIVVVTFITSTVAVRLQEIELRHQTETVGYMIVRSLQAVAKDPLLLNDYVSIQDFINNFVKRKVPGMEALAVVDRFGKIIAHVEMENVEKTISADRFDEITRADSALLVETPTHYRFVQAVYTFNKRRIFLGGCSVSFSKTVLLSPIEEMRRQIVVTSFVVACLAILIVYVVSKKLVRIIIVLSDAARRVGAGDLKVTVITRIKDEVGSLAKEFNYMVAQLREKIEMQKFVSRSTVQMISEGKEMTLGGTRRVITAMFTDIRNFTSVSENKWPEEVVETLNHYLDLQTKVIHDYKGIVDKFLGDGIMSIFTGDKMVHNAVTAAIELQRKVAEMNKQRQKSNEIVLEIGVGLATGVAVLGSIGSRDRMDYTAIGDTVNLASRLCGIAGPKQILANEDFVKRLNGEYSTKSEGKIAIKGKQGPVPVHEISYSLT